LERRNIVKRVLLILILALALLPIGCVQNAIRNYADEYVGAYTADCRITLVSDPGMPFSGRYLVITTVWDPAAQTIVFLYDLYDIEGEIPPAGYMEYLARDAVAVAGSFQKRTGDHVEFSAELWKGTERIEVDETTDPWGMVMVAGL